MSTLRIRWTAACAMVLAAAAMPVAAAEGSYPSKPIRVVVPYPPGGANDVIARVVGDKMRASLGQPVIVENRPGANGNIAAALVSRLPGDGYTLLVGNLSLMVHNALLYSRLEYDARDFVPIARVAESVMLVKVRRDSAFKTVQELIAYGKANPGKLNYGSVGNGSVTHLAAEMFRAMAGFSAEHIPLGGGAQAMAELVSGRIDFVVDPALFGSAQAQLRVLAVLDRQRREGLPDVPTVAEAGLPAFDANSWLAFFGPRGTPAEAVQRLNSEINSAIAASEVRERMVNFGLNPKGGSVAELVQLIEASNRTWTPLIRKLGVRID